MMRHHVMYPTKEIGAAAQALHFRCYKTSRLQKFPLLFLQQIPNISSNKQASVCHNPLQFNPNAFLMIQPIRIQTRVFDPSGDETTIVTSV
jgi:hypothetical protein